MKIFLITISLLMLILSNLSGAVKNGYEKSVPGLMFSLRGLQTILYCDSTLSGAKKRDIKRKIKLVISTIAYHRITDRLLIHFKAIAPDLYSQIDTLRDAAGKIIDVYVKYIPGDETQFWTAGATSLAQAPNDVNSCNSEYGEGSVSVVISAMNNALRVLAHEFGHIMYVVPNMKSYAAFFRLRYRNNASAVVLGHHLLDEGGRTAFTFERRFRLLYRQYLRQESAPSKSFMVRVNPIKRDLLEAIAYDD